MSGNLKQKSGKRNYPFFQRDLSWLGFNQRVLMEAADPELPLYERIKFMAIYSSNLEEFFKVRVAVIRSFFSVGSQKKQAALLLDQISKTVNAQQASFGKIFKNEIIPGLSAHQIHLLLAPDYSVEQKLFIQHFFRAEVWSLLQPILLVKDRQVPFLQDGTLYLVCGLSSIHKRGKPETQTRQRYALIPVPKSVPRFISIPGPGPYGAITFIEDVIREALPILLTGYQVTCCYAIKVSRDADLGIEDEYSGNLVEKVKRSLGKRKTGLPARFLYDESMPSAMRNYLRGCYKIKKYEMVPGARYHHFSDFFSFPNPVGAALERPHFPPLPVMGMEKFPTLFEAIKARDWLLHFPYHGYDTVLQLLQEAALDPKVTEIMATQYRVAANSAVVNAFISAALHGKKVTVFVEVKARFDEEVNIMSAKRMEEAGVRILYSIPGLKVHAKCCLIFRESGNKRGKRKFAFISTGNFNEKTARLYADHGLLTAHSNITDELEIMFLELQHLRGVARFKNILVSKFNMVSYYLDLIENEIRFAKAGKTSGIFLKVNNLEDPEMIAALYRASEAGVPVKIIVRSVCCLVPESPLSKNIEVRRIVDRYLEHARVFMVKNGGQIRVFMGSADWMKRNLRSRIELGVEIAPVELRKEMMDFYHWQWEDNVASRRLKTTVEMEKLVGETSPKIRAQEAIYGWISEGKPSIDAKPLI
jgi:polyphosphate kinase